MPLTRTAAEIWRKFNTAGVPASGFHKPDQDEIATWGTEVEEILHVGASRIYTGGSPLVVDVDDNIILVAMASPAPLTITLPLAADKIGNVTIVDLNGQFAANPAAVTRSGSDTILGTTAFGMTAAYQVTTFNPVPSLGKWWVG